MHLSIDILTIDGRLIEAALWKTEQLPTGPAVSRVATVADMTARRAQCYLMGRALEIYGATDVQILRRDFSPR